MEKHIQNIERINQYINGQLSEAEKLNFENQLQTDPDFNALYQEHLDFVEGLKRIALKRDIKAAKQSYVKAKWFKDLGLPILVVGVSVVCYSLLFNETKVVKTETNIEDVKIQSDVTTKETETQTEITVEDSIDTTKVSTGILVPENKSESAEESQVKVETTVEKPIDTNKPKADIVSVKKEALVEEKRASLDLSTIYKSIKKAPQILVINTEKDTTIICKEGTRIRLKAKSFVDANTNRLARGKITIEITEFYKLSDMLLANLSTKSDADQLETGGMLYVSASKSGKRLKLKTGSTIEYAFPTDKKKKDMQLFLGEKTAAGINWKLENPTDNLIEELEFIEEDIEVPFAVVEQPPIYPGCENGTNLQRKACMTRALQKLVQRKFNTNVADDLDLTGSQKITMVFKIDKEGFITDIRVRAPHPVLEQEALRVINLLPPMQPGRQRGKTVIVPYSLPIIYRIEGDTKGVFGNSNDRSQTPLVSPEYVKELEAKIENESPQEVSKSELNWYVFRSSNLGWINCDRFARSRKPKIKFKLKIKDSDGADIKLIFKNIKSILPGKKTGDTYDYGSVPKDEDIVLIAIKKSEEAFYLGIKEGKTGAFSDIALDFNKMSIGDIKKKIEALKTAF